MSEITRCFIYEKEVRGSFVREDHPRDAAILDIIRRVPLIVKITGLMLFAHVVCAVLNVTFYVHQEASVHRTNLWDQTLDFIAERCSFGGLSASKGFASPLISSASKLTKKRNRIAISGLIGLLSVNLEKFEKDEFQISFFPFSFPVSFF